MKKMLVESFFDFLEKLEDVNSGKIKILNTETVIKNLLFREEPEESLSIYLIPKKNSDLVLMLFPSPTPKIFEFIETKSPFIVSYISVAHINRLFLFTDQIFFLSEE